MLDDPFGVFTPLQDGKPKLFIAGGIGITPFLSIIGVWNSGGFKQKVTLVWNCRTLDDMVHRNMFETCASNHREFSFIPLITSAEHKTAHAKRVNRQLLGPLVIALERSSLEAYICGPETLRRSVTADLRSCGILAKNVHHENFSQ